MPSDMHVAGASMTTKHVLRKQVLYTLTTWNLFWSVAPVNHEKVRLEDWIMNFTRGGQIIFQFLHSCAVLPQLSFSFKWRNPPMKIYPEPIIASLLWNLPFYFVRRIQLVSPGNLRGAKLWGGETMLFVNDQSPGKKSTSHSSLLVNLDFEQVWQQKSWALVGKPPH